MKISAAVIVTMTCGMSLAACTPLPKAFTPHTADEPAVVQTIATFLSAWNARDMERLNTLVLPEATMEAFVDGSRIPPERILAVRQRPDEAPLQQATADRLVDFRQSSATSISVGTYVYNVVRRDRGSDQITTRLRWDLIRDNGAWHIQHLAQTTWVHPLDIGGSGP
jgi:SnoaL-like domain